VICPGSSWLSRDVPTTPFVTMDAGGFFACGVDADGHIECWGNNGSHQCEPPLDVSYVRVSGGNSHACGLTTDSEVVCWGAGGDGECSVPH
jgi:alpha-tubulin suppressor-like RCC1 family protein